MIIAGYNVYNEIEHIEESVKSVYDKVDKIVFVDGRYKGFYEDKPVASTDGTVQWIKDKDNDPDNKFHLIKAPKKPWAKQAFKRSAYLVGDVGDIYLQIDGHEVVEDFKGFNLLLNEVGFARIDLPENAVPVSVKQPRIFAHKEGLRYITHAYLITEDEGGHQELFLNMAWDQLTILPMENFTKEVNPESYCLTLKHLGPQRTELEQRKKQASSEKDVVHMFDDKHGIAHGANTNAAVDRFAERLHKSYREQFPKRGWPVPSYALVRSRVAIKAREWEQQQTDIKKYNKDVGENHYEECPVSGCGFKASFMDMITHVADKHPKKAKTYSM